jgi:hypothetical protein
MAEVLIARFQVLTALLRSAVTIFRNVGNHHPMTLHHIPEELNLKYLSPSIFMFDLQVRMWTLSCWRTAELHIVQSGRVDRNCNMGWQTVGQGSAVI